MKSLKIGICFVLLCILLQDGYSFIEFVHNYLNSIENACISINKLEIPESEEDNEESEKEEKEEKKIKSQLDFKKHSGLLLSLTKINYFFFNDSKTFNRDFEIETPPPRLFIQS